jgi:hypothetical protein
MGFWRRCATVGCMAGCLVALACSSSCGGGGEAKPKTTPLPLQPSGLAVGGDVQAQATDVAQTRVTQGQLKEIASACRKAIEITDVSQDSCGSAVLKSFKRRVPCKSGSPCMTVWKVRKPQENRIAGKTSDLAGFVQITDDRRCASAPGNVCLRVGVPETRRIPEIVGTPQPGGSAPESGGASEEGSPGPEPDSGEPESPAPENDSAPPEEEAPGQAPAS